MPRRVEVAKLSPEGKVLEKYYSMRDAADKNYTDPKTIWRGVRSGRMVIGFFWKDANESKLLSTGKS
ncbi:MAG: hypothetical protein AB9856_20805 [Cellulosilyticaceae bacterium]